MAINLLHVDIVCMHDASNLKEKLYMFIQIARQEWMLAIIP